MKANHSTKKRSSDAQRLEAFEHQNAKLKRLLAEAELDEAEPRPTETSDPDRQDHGDREPDDHARLWQ